MTQLTRRSIALLEQRKLDEAEPVLLQAVSLDPTSYINLYNLACLKALRGQADIALNYLEMAAEAGYTDFIHLGIDPDLTSLRDLPRYRTFVAKKPLYQRRAADRALASLKQQFGDGYLYELDEQDKLIFATNVDRETLDALKKSLKAQARSQWAQLFEHRPDEFIRVVVPSPQDYKKLIRMPGVGGIYMDGSKLLIAQRLGQVMTHEFTHALHAADRAPLDQEHPIWLVEGLGSLFEASSFEGPNHDVLVPHDNFRITYLQHAASGSDSKLIPLEKLLKMEQPEFVNKANMAYGESSSFLLYLYEQKQLKPFYDAFKKSYDADPTGRAARGAGHGEEAPRAGKRLGRVAEAPHPAADEHRAGRRVPRRPARRPRHRVERRPADRHDPAQRPGGEGRPEGRRRPRRDQRRGPARLPVLRPHDEPLQARPADHPARAARREVPRRSGPAGQALGGGQRRAATGT